MEEKTLKSASVQEFKSHDSKHVILSSMIASSIGNFVSLLASHPLDTLKIRQQMDLRNGISSKQFAHELITVEGYRGLFKGMFQPLASSFPVIMSQFATTEYSRRCIAE